MARARGECCGRFLQLTAARFFPHKGIVYVYFVTAARFFPLKGMLYIFTSKCPLTVLKVQISQGPGQFFQIELLRTGRSPVPLITPQLSNPYTEFWGERQAQTVSSCARRVSPDRRLALACLARTKPCHAMPCHAMPQHITRWDTCAPPRGRESKSSPRPRRGLGLRVRRLPPRGPLRGAGRVPHEARPGSCRGGFRRSSVLLVSCVFLRTSMFPHSSLISLC